MKVTVDSLPSSRAADSVLKQPFERLDRFLKHLRRHHRPPLFTEAYCIRPSRSSSSVPLCPVRMPDLGHLRHRGGTPPSKWSSVTWAYPRAAANRTRSGSAGVRLEAAKPAMTAGDHDCARCPRRIGWKRVSVREFERTDGPAAASARIRGSPWIRASNMPKASAALVGGPRHPLRGPRPTAAVDVGAVAVSRRRRRCRRRIAWIGPRC